MPKFLRNYKLRELSFVDDPACEQARVTIHKAKMEPVEKPWSSIADLPKQVQSLPTEAKQVFMRVANQCLADGDSDESAMRQAWTAVENGWKKSESDEWVRKSESTGDNEMTIEQLQAQLTELQKKHDVEKTRADKAESELKVEKAFHEATKTELSAKIEKAKKDEVIKVGEQEIRKSVVGDEMYAILKAQNDRAVALETQLDLASVEKRVSQEFGKLPGEAIAKAKFFRELSGLTKESKEVGETMLKAGQEAMVSLTKELGSRTPGGFHSGEDKIEKIAREIQKADSKLTYEQAYVQALSTPDGLDAYRESKAERQAH